MDDCIFCRIAGGEIPSKKVYEDDNVLAFDDISPQAPVHVIIIPKKHIKSVDSLAESDRDVIYALNVSFGKVAKLKGVDETGYRVVTNHLENAGQSVFHLHFHLLGGRKMKWPPG